MFYVNEKTTHLNQVDKDSTDRIVSEGSQLIECAEAALARGRKLLSDIPYQYTDKNLLNEREKIELEKELSLFIQKMTEENSDLLIREKRKHSNMAKFLVNRLRV